MKTITIGALSIQFTPPPSVAVAYDLIIASNKNRQRAAAAALGLGWPADGEGMTAPLEAEYEESYDPMAFGGEVFDELVARGFEAAPIWPASTEAYNYRCGKAVPSKAEVEAAVGNSEPTEDSTTA